MIKSDNTIDLISALLEVQKELKPVLKNAENPYFKMKYADLASIVEASRAILVKNGLVITQTIDFEGDINYLCTTLWHTSGQFISSRLRLKPVKDDPQSTGSAITYAKRYSLSSMIGLITEEDDDAEGAMGRQNESLIPKEIMDAKAQAKQELNDAIDTAQKTFPGSTVVSEKVDSEKKFAGFHGSIMECKDLKQLSEWWTSFNSIAYTQLTEEHYKMLVELKEFLKKKFTAVKGE